MRTEMAIIKAEIETANLHRAKIADKLKIVAAISTMAIPSRVVNPSEVIDNDRYHIGHSKSLINTRPIITEADFCNPKDAGITQNVKTFADIVSKPASGVPERKHAEANARKEVGNSHSDERKCGFRLPRYARERRKKEKKEKFERGTGLNHKLKSRPPPPFQMYLGNMSPDTTINDVMDFAQDELDFEILVCDLPRKGDDYVSFKITCDIKHRNVIFDPAIWPDNGIIRKYYNTMTRPTESSSN